MVTERQEQDGSFYFQIRFMENESVLSRVVRKGTFRKSTVVRALRLWDRGGQLHVEGRHSLANQALALKRTVEDVQNVKRNAVTGCLWVLKLIIWTRKLVFSVLDTQQLVLHRRGGHGVHVGL